MVFVLGDNWSYSSLPFCCGILELGDFNLTDEQWEEVESGEFDWEGAGQEIQKFVSKPIIVASTGGGMPSAAVVEKLEIPGYTKQLITSQAPNPNTGNRITMAVWVKQ